MLGLAVSSVVAFAALVSFALAVGLVRHHPLAGIGMAALIIVPLWETPTPPSLSTFAGLNITVADVITLILFVVGMLEFTQLRTNLQGWLVPWLFLGVLIAISILRGAATHGLGAATNEARGELWVYFAMTWALAIRPDRLRLHTVSVVLGWTLVLVALYHGVEHGLGSPTTVVIHSDGSYGPNRILVAGQAAALLLCAGFTFLKTADSERGRPRFAASSLVFLGIVLLSQHRSVWVAGVVGMTAVLISARGGRALGRARSRAFTALSVGVWLAFVGWIVWGGSNELIDSAVDSNTLDWRTSGWETLVSDAFARGPVSVAIGEPYGSGFLRTVGHVTTGVHPHNWYVGIFLRVGIIGLMVLVGMLLAAVWKSRARSTEWMFSLVAVGVYAFSYSVDWFLTPWLAAAIVVSLRGDGAPNAAVESTTSNDTSKR